MRVHSLGFVLEHLPSAEGNIEAEEWQADPQGPEEGKDGSPGLLSTDPWQPAVCQVFTFCRAWRNLSN